MTTYQINGEIAQEVLTEEELLIFQTLFNKVKRTELIMEKKKERQKEKQEIESSIESILSKLQETLESTSEQITPQLFEHFYSSIVQEEHNRKRIPIHAFNVGLYQLVKQLNEQK